MNKIEAKEMLNKFFLETEKNLKILTEKNLNKFLKGLTDEQALQLIEQLKNDIPEADEEDIGKLCKFWDNDEKINCYGILCNITEKSIFPYSCELESVAHIFKHARRLTDDEIEEII